MLFRAFLLLIVAGLAIPVPASAVSLPIGDTLQLSGLLLVPTPSISS